MRGGLRFALALSLILAHSDVRADAPDLLLVDLSSGMRGFCPSEDSCALGKLIGHIEQQLGASETELMGFFRFQGGSDGDRDTVQTFYVWLRLDQLAEQLKVPMDRLRTAVDAKDARITSGRACRARDTDLTGPLRDLRTASMPSRPEAAGDTQVAMGATAPGRGRGASDFRNVLLLTDNFQDADRPEDRASISGLVTELDALTEPDGVVPRSLWLHTVAGVPFWGRASIGARAFHQLVPERPFDLPEQPRCGWRVSGPDLLRFQRHVKSFRCPGEPQDAARDSSFAQDCERLAATIDASLGDGRRVFLVEPSQRRTALWAYYAGRRTLVAYGLSRTAEPPLGASTVLAAGATAKVHAPIPLFPPPEALTRDQVHLAAVEVTVDPEGRVHVTPEVDVGSDLRRVFGIEYVEVRYTAQVLETPSSTSADRTSWTFVERIPLDGERRPLGMDERGTGGFELHLDRQSGWVEWFRPQSSRFGVQVELVDVRAGPLGLELPKPMASDSQLAAETDPTGCFLCRELVDTLLVGPAAEQPRLPLEQQRTAWLPDVELRGEASARFHDDLAYCALAAVVVTCLVIYLCWLIGLGGAIRGLTLSGKGGNSIALESALYFALLVGSTWPLLAWFGHWFEGDRVVWYGALFAGVGLVIGLLLALVARHRCRRLMEALLEGEPNPEVQSAPPPALEELRLLEPLSVAEVENEGRDILELRGGSSRPFGASPLPVVVLDCTCEAAHAALNELLEVRRRLRAHAIHEAPLLIHACDLPRGRRCPAVAVLEEVAADGQPYVSQRNQALRASVAQVAAIVLSPPEATARAAPATYLLQPASRTGQRSVIDGPGLYEFFPDADGADDVVEAVMHRMVGPQLGRLEELARAHGLPVRGVAGAVRPTLSVAWVRDTSKRLYGTVSAAIRFADRTGGELEQADLPGTAHAWCGPTIAGPLVHARLFLHRRALVALARRIEEARRRVVRRRVQEALGEVDACRAVLAMSNCGLKRREQCS